MATGDADKLAAGLLSGDPDNHATFDSFAQDFSEDLAFLRGFRACVAGGSYGSGWSNYRQQGYKAAQALGLFGVWP